MPDEDLIQQWAELSLSDLCLQGVELCLRVVSEAEIRCLNKKYRGKDRPTNVLSFTNETPAGRMVDENGRILLGDIIVCKEVVQRESRSQGKSVNAHFAHLLIHGILHLQGHDHSVDDQASEMEAIEKRLLLNLGYDDPYL
jgi:probable rRNA maturation factor